MRFQTIDRPGTFAATAFDDDPTAISESATTNLGEIILNYVGRRMTLEVENTGTAALASFKIQAKAHADGEWFDWITSAELNTGTAIDGRLLTVLTDPTTLAAAGFSHIVFDVSGFYAIRFVAQADTDPGELTLRGSHSNA